LGGTALHRAAIYEQMWCSGFVLPEGLQGCETLGPTLIKFGRPIARSHFASYMRGDELWCQGFSEPDAGSDLAAIRTVAVEDGDCLRVTGQKAWSSQAAVATRCMLLVRTGQLADRHKGLSMVMADLHSPGVTVRMTRAASGRYEFAEIFFDDTEIPRDSILGELGQGWAIAMYMLQWERGMYGWQRQAYLHRRLSDLLQAGDHEADKQRIGDTYLTLYALRAQCMRTARRLASGQNPGPEISIDKILLSTAEQALFDLIRDLQGPKLELGDDPIASQLRSEWFYTRAASIYGGAVEIQRDVIAERILELPRDGRRGT
jgi:hypothetical protein